MSLYNMLFGENEYTPVLLGVLGLDKESFGRFRDIYLNKDGSKIIVLTRCGGGNRECYENMFEEMSKHENYIKDYDDDFDCTYAYIEFSIPEKFKDMCKSLATGENPKTVHEKFETHMNNANDPNSEEAKKDEEVARKIMEALSNPSSDGINFIKL